MDSKVFWGLVIILIGVSIIINHVFKVDFPLFKVIIALIIIYFGFSILFGSFKFNKASSGDFSHYFTSKNYEPAKIDGNMEFNCVFGSSKIDLRRTVFTGQSLEIEINSIFSSVQVYLPQNLNIDVKASSAFGSVRSPGNRQDGIGDQRYTVRGGVPGEKLLIEANAVFGSLNLD